MHGGEVYLTPSLTLSLNRGSCVPQREQVGLGMHKEDKLDGWIGLDWIELDSGSGLADCKTSCISWQLPTKCLRWLV